jgi:methyl-accepting chemotaxis protein
VDHLNRKRQLAESLTGITQSSEETHKIVKTIDEIAFQRVLLALNAAVEAATAEESASASEEMNAPNR